MVLKTCLLFLLLLSATSYAKRGSKQYFKQAQKQFKSKNYSKSITLLKKGYNFKRPKQMPASVLFLTGSNYQKLGQYDRSNYFYNQLIKNVYGKKHKKVMNAFKKNQVDDLELPSTLGATYINLGKNYFALFRKKGNHQSAKKAKMYIKICDEVDIADECSDLLEKINYSITKNQLNKTRKMFYLQIGRLLFQDRIEVKETASGITSSLVSNNASICYGAGLRVGSMIKGWDFSGCVLSGTTTVEGTASSQSGTNFQYVQSGVPIAGMLLEGGYYYTFDQQKARVGVNFPLLYRAGSYSEPVGYTITDPTAFLYGISFVTGIQLPYIELQIKLAHMENTNSLLLNFVYNF